MVLYYPPYGRQFDTYDAAVPRDEGGAEVHLQPRIFPVLRVLADRNPLPCRFLLLGSASPDLVRWGSETLAGRIEFINMDGFSLEELSSCPARDKLCLRGGFPMSLLAENDSDSFA